MPRITLSLMLLLATARTALADEPPPTPPSTPPGSDTKAPPDAAKSSFGGLVDGRFGLGMVEEDLFVSLNIGTVLRWSKLAGGIQVPLRFRAWDRAPEQGTVLRKEDWDEVSDYFKLIRFISWGEPEDWLYARLGQINGATFAHGTLIDRYYNVIDSDHYQAGIQLHLDLDKGGADVLLDNIAYPSLLGLRGFVRPMRFGELPKWTHGFMVGMSLVGDFVAPSTPVLDRTNRRQVSEKGNLVQETTPVTLIGFDIGWEVLKNDWVALTPFLDVNILANTGGTGMHLGMMATFQIGSPVRLGLRAEYRVLRSDFAPSYVNSWYTVERVDFLDGKSKIAYFQDIKDRGLAETRHGWHASFDLTLFDKVTLTGVLEDYQGPSNANLMIRLLLPYIAGVQLNLYYAKRNFDSAKEAFDLDRGLLVAEARYKFWGPLYVHALYAREWKLDKDPVSADFGRYQTRNVWDVGFGAEFSW